jgi:hypothetical protein
MSGTEVEAEDIDFLASAYGSSLKAKFKVESPFRLVKRKATGVVPVGVGVYNRHKIVEGQLSAFQGE